MPKKIISVTKNRRLMTNTYGAIGLLLIAPLLIKLVMFLVVVAMIFWVLSNLVNIAIGITLIMIPIFLMLVSVILVKRYLFTKKPEVKT